MRPKLITLGRAFGNGAKVYASSLLGKKRKERGSQSCQAPELKATEKNVSPYSAFNLIPSRKATHLTFSKGAWQFTAKLLFPVVAALFLIGFILVVESENKRRHK